MKKKEYFFPDIIWECVSTQELLAASEPELYGSETDVNDLFE